MGFLLEMLFWFLVPFAVLVTVIKFILIFGG